MDDFDFIVVCGWRVKDVIELFSNKFFGKFDIDDLLVEIEDLGIVGFDEMFDREWVVGDGSLDIGYFVGRDGDVYI